MENNERRMRRREEERGGGKEGKRAKLMSLPDAKFSHVSGSGFTPFVHISVASTRI